MEQPEIQSLPEPSPSFEFTRTPDPNLSLTPDKHFCFSSDKPNDESVPRQARALFSQSKKKSLRRGSSSRSSDENRIQVANDEPIVPLQEVQEHGTLKLQKKLHDLVLSDLDVSQELASELKKSNHLQMEVLSKSANKVNVTPSRKLYKDLTPVELSAKQIQNSRIKCSLPVANREKDPEPDLMEPMFSHLYPEIKEQPVFCKSPPTDNSICMVKAENEAFTLYRRMHVPSARFE